MKIEQKADNEITINNQIMVCENSDGLYVISPRDGYTLSLNEFGVVVAVPDGKRIAISEHGALSAA